MSIIDTANHNVVPYISGKTKPFTGQRLATVTYKTITDKSHPLCGVKRESKAVSLPVIESDTIEVNLGALMPHIKSLCYGAQDKILREYLDDNPNAVSISNELISIGAILEYLDNSNESGRLTKESVASWFDASIADTLTVTLADKLGVSDTPSETETRQINAVMKEFKDKVSALAGGKTSYTPKVCESLKKCLALAPADDVIAARFVARLDKMIAESVSAEALFDAL